MSKLKWLVSLVWIFSLSNLYSQPGDFSVIAYYAGGPKNLDSFEVEKLTHIIFSFSHLKANRLNIDNAEDSATIFKLVSLKKRNPGLKVILSLGGWGGCAPCSEVFATKKGRKEFARSVKELSVFFGTDGIDLDWEYPAIEGYPSHKYQPADKQNFTSLVVELRTILGKKYEISFAAGGFQKFIDEAVEWDKVMKLVDRVNLMTYDLVNGNSPVTGHHTALYGTSAQIESTDNAVTRLVNAGVPKEKLVIGAAFYARVWENVPDTNYGLYQNGRFKTSVSYKNFASRMPADSGFVYHWDETASGPFIYNTDKKLFATFDDPRSLELKVKYGVEKGLNGIMFWELSHDFYKGGLLDAIDKARKKYIIRR